MLYGFDTEDREQATAALLVYAVYRSRDTSRFKVTPDMWSGIERFTKGAAKRSKTIGQFIERLKPRLMCETLRPKAMEVGLHLDQVLDGPSGEPVRTADRQFLTWVIQQCVEPRVLRLLYEETALIILLVRDRLERERPIESRIRQFTEAE